jgi:hemerythrin superfamily protein
VSSLRVEPRPRRPNFVLTMLSEDHQRLEGLFREIVASCQRGEHANLRADWDRFERELTSHLDLEEKELLPGFARRHLAEAQGLLEEHAAIRAGLTELGVELDLHCLRAERVEAFITGLRAHARREEALLYPWSSQLRD